MSYIKDLVFLDLEWLTFNKKNYITQIGIVRVDKQSLTIKKQRLFKLKNNVTNNFQLGLIGAKSASDKGMLTLNRKVVKEIYQLLNNSDIYIYFDPNNQENDDLKLLTSVIRFDDPLVYELHKIHTKWSLRHLYANYRHHQYVYNMFHNALDDALMLKEIYFANFMAPKPSIPFYEYCCNFHLYPWYATHKQTIRLVIPNNPTQVYKMHHLSLRQNLNPLQNETYKLKFHTYQFEFSLTNCKTNQTIIINNQNAYLFIALVPQILLEREKISFEKLEDILQTIFIEQNCFLSVLTRKN